MNPNVSRMIQIIKLLWKQKKKKKERKPAAGTAGGARKSEKVCFI